MLKKCFSLLFTPWIYFKPKPFCYAYVWTQHISGYLVYICTVHLFYCIKLKRVGRFAGFKGITLYETKTPFRRICSKRFYLSAPISMFPTRRIKFRKFYAEIWSSKGVKLPPFPAENPATSFAFPTQFLLFSERRKVGKFEPCGMTQTIKFNLRRQQNTIF